MDTVIMIRLVAGLLFFLVFVPLYFLPAIIARRKRDATAIFWLNLLAGWTFLGWVGALIWAITNDTSTIIVQQVMPQAQLCSKCGHYSTAGAQFCSSCGQPFGFAKAQASGG
jgi:hypothetical protein